MKTTTNLFANLEQVPSIVRGIVETHFEVHGDNFTYSACAELLERLKPNGWTCDYGLDAIPYDLKRIEN